jgi:site-specific recombinase XerD
LKKEKTPITVLTADEIELLINSHLVYGKYRKYSPEEVSEHLNFVYTTAIMFLAYTGCRFEEMAGLRRKYLDLSDGKVTFVRTKNKDIRNAYITQRLISCLEKLAAGKSPDDVLFTNMTWKKIQPGEFAEDLKKRAEAVGIKKRVHPHLFRHSYATSLYVSTKDMGMVQVVLGHRDIKSTQIYVHIADELVRRAMRQHPFIRMQIPVEEFIEQVEDQIRNMKIHEDPRLNKMVVREAVNDFMTKLYKAAA